MYPSLFCRRWRTASTCKQMLQQLQSRLKLLISREQELSRGLRSDIIMLIRLHASKHALRRTEYLVNMKNSIIVYELLLRFTNYMIIHIPYIEKHRKLFSDKIKEAVSSLVFASASRGEQLRELVIIRELFCQRYGRSYIKSALQLLPGNHVNLQMKEILSTRSVSEGAKSRLFDEIAKVAEAARCRLLNESAKDYDNLIEAMRLKHTREIDKQVNKKEEKKAMNSDLNCCSDKQSPDEVYKFSLTYYEEEMRKEEKIMEDDYIKAAQVGKEQRVVRSRESSEEERRSSSLSDEIDHGHRSEVMRLKYAREIDRQVNKKEEKSMKDDYLEEAHVGQYRRVLRFRERIEEDRRSSSLSEDVKSRLLDEIAREPGRVLKKTRREYAPETVKQVNEEEEKKVMDSDDQSPEEVYKSSLSDLKEEIRKEERSMEDGYIDEVQLGKDQRVFRFKEGSEEKRRSSSSSSSSASLLSIKELRDLESMTYYKKRKRTTTHLRRRRRPSVVYNEFDRTKEGQEDRQKGVANQNVHPKLSDYDQIVNQTKAVKAKEEEERQRLVLKHVHPRLPDYDQMVYEMKTVKANEEERRRLATQHVHPKLPDYNQLVAYFKGLKKQQCMRC